MTTGKHIAQSVCFMSEQQPKSSEHKIARDDSALKLRCSD